MGIVKKISVLFSFCFLMVGYNNCSQPAGLPINSDPQLSTSVVAEANGGGHPGKLTYDFFSRDPVCGNSSVLAQELTIDRSQQIAEISVCQSPSAVVTDYSEIFYNSYNPYLAFYNQRVFALKELHQDLVGQGRISYNLFCYNSALQMDFTIRYFRPYNPDVGPSVIIKGILFDAGSGNGVNVIETSGLTRDPDASGVFPFIASDNSYRFEYSRSSSVSAPAEGRLYYQNGDRVLFQCLTNFVTPDSR